MAVVVVGSIGGDVVAQTARHPEAGETVMGTALHRFPGGKGANQALAAARAGAPTRMVGRIGDDEAGRVQLHTLAAAGVDIGGITIAPESPTQTAIIVVDDDGENRIVVVPGASAEVAARDVEELRLTSDDVVVAQFETPQPAISAAFQRAHACGARTLLNAAPALEPEPGLLELVDILVVNESEASALSNCDRRSDDQMASVARLLRTRPEQVVVVTLGAAGALAVDGADTHVVAGHGVEVVDTTGAGDCFVGYLAASVSRGATLPEALIVANRAAAVCVQTLGAGTSMPRLSEVMG